MEALATRQRTVPNLLRRCVERVQPWQPKQMLRPRGQGPEPLRARLRQW